MSKDTISKNAWIEYSKTNNDNISPGGVFFELPEEELIYLCNPEHEAIPQQKARELAQGDIGIRVRGGILEYVIYYEPKDEWQKMAT